MISYVELFLKISELFGMLFRLLKTFAILLIFDAILSAVIFYCFEYRSEPLKLFLINFGIVLFIYCHVIAEMSSDRGLKFNQ